MNDVGDRDIYSQVARLFGSSPLSLPISSPLRPLHPSEYKNSSPIGRGNQYRTVADVGILHPTSHQGLLPALPTILEEAEADSDDGRGDSEASSHADNKENLPELDISALQNVLQYIESRGLTWSDVVKYISDPKYKQGASRYYGFFRDSARVKQVLSFWTSWQNSTMGREVLHEWTLQYLCKKISLEGQASTKDRFLQSRLQPIDETFIQGFSMPSIYTRIQELCPTSLQLRVASTILDLLEECSQLNSWKKHILGLFAYASGVTSQMITVLNTLGICSSYLTLTGTQKRAGKLLFKLRLQDHFSVNNILNPMRTVTGIPPACTFRELQSDAETDLDSEDEDLQTDQHEHG
ncbi:uncharacterized protein PHACADRAFT_183060 [Phanerochaete carnosa HHB-10118-sp]|uniref:Uncharacterized protein n=1 Tax=Phanerochaete carnosa (strain HHB-10118-sp) TaxID=650164 RepID=K5V1J2_PHACS|nr:uncharacterized protein PHACADRAFT_183060 [Phanerochaete carnosa HHB-10118-sp]EKM56351.1 hypothetical protein PHACADRAFT_183060 [Phanerochaete carnosa HHB-10118-sp]